MDLPADESFQEVGHYPPTTTGDSLCEACNPAITELTKLLRSPGEVLGHRVHLDPPLLRYMTSFLSSSHLPPIHNLLVSAQTCPLCKVLDRNLRETYGDHVLDNLETIPGSREVHVVASRDDTRTPHSYASGVNTIIFKLIREGNNFEFASLRVCAREG